MENLEKYNEVAGHPLKKEWKDPEIEIISKDNILAAKHINFPETSTSLGLLS